MGVGGRAMSKGTGSRLGSGQGFWTELGILGGWMGVRLWRTWVLAKFLGADNQAYMGVFGENLDINKAQEPGHAI